MILSVIVQNDVLLLYTIASFSFLNNVPNCSMKKLSYIILYI